MTTPCSDNNELALWDALFNEPLETDAEEENGWGSESGEDYVDPYERVANASLAFEQNWTLERDVASIEETLQTIPEEARDELFERLLEIDATLSAKKGALLPEATYCELFPERVAAVKRVYAAVLAEPSVAATLRVGRRVGPYKIEEIVGVGGMGVVYKARDERFGREVALKFLSTRGGDRREECVERFKREIWLMGQTPPGSAFAQAYDCATDGEFDYYIAMEFVDGVNLARHYREREENGRRETGPLPWLEAAKLTREIASGLAEIHELGFAHRDVKPENVMLDASGRTRILDLGLAVWTEKRGRTTADGDAGSGDETIDDGAVVGTPAYIAPEARRDPERVDQRSDLYSLGGVLLFLMTGARPIDWFDPAATETPEPFEEFWARREIEPPTEIVAILTRLLEPDCERRYQRAADVVADLNATIDKYSPELRSARRRRSVRRCATTAAIAAALGGVVFYSFGLNDLRNFGKARRWAASGDVKHALDLASNVNPAGLWNDKTRIEFFRLRGDLGEKLAKDREALEFALQDFEALLLLDATNGPALERAASLYAKLERFEEAKDCLERALERNQFDPRLKRLGGEIFVLQGESDQADVDPVECFDEAINALTDALGSGAEVRKAQEAKEAKEASATDEAAANESSATDGKADGAGSGIDGADGGAATDEANATDDGDGAALAAIEAGEAGEVVWDAAIEAETLYWRARAYCRHRAQHYEHAWDDLDDALELQNDYLDALKLRGEVLLRLARKTGYYEFYADYSWADYRRVAELSKDAEPKEQEEWLNKLARCYARDKNWARCLVVCEEAARLNKFADWPRLRSCEARLYLAFDRQDAIDWSAASAELDAALAGRFDEDLESEAFFASMWALRAWTGWREAETAASDEAKRKILRKILDAIDEALLADENKYEYEFETSFDLNDLGRAVAFELGDVEKAESYERRKDEREARRLERRGVLE